MDKMFGLTARLIEEQLAKRALVAGLLLVERKVTDVSITLFYPRLVIMMFDNHGFVSIRLFFNSKLLSHYLFIDGYDPVRVDELFEGCLKAMETYKPDYKFLSLIDD